MFIVEDRIRGLRALVLIGRHVFNIFAGGSMARVMMVIAVGLGDRMMCIRLIVLELIGMVLAKCGVKVLFLIRPVFVSIK